MTQRDRVLSLLRDGPVCSTTFLSEHVPRFSARLFELRNDGYRIIKRRCEAHPWHRQYEFVLVEPSGQLTLS